MQDADAKAEAIDLNRNSFDQSKIADQPLML